MEKRKSKSRPHLFLFNNVKKDNVFESNKIKRDHRKMVKKIEYKKKPFRIVLNNYSAKYLSELNQSKQKWIDEKIICLILFKPNFNRQFENKQFVLALVLTNHSIGHFYWGTCPACALGLDLLGTHVEWRRSLQFLWLVVLVVELVVSSWVVESIKLIIQFEQLSARCCHWYLSILWFILVKLC